MLEIRVIGATTWKSHIKSEIPLTTNEVWAVFEESTGLPSLDFYLTQNDRPIHDPERLLDGNLTITPRLLGGKGGFGSMLRAIGAQIEKTTNREACRDLSGRRLRDINEEKRLKTWIEKQAKREEEAAARKKKKLQRLCAEPKHEFEDKSYEQERSVLTERVGSAVEEGFKAAGPSGTKRKTDDEDSGDQKKRKKTKAKTLLDLDIDSDELSSSSGESDSEEQKFTKRTDADSGNSSEEGKSSKEDQKKNISGSDLEDKSESNGGDTREGGTDSSVEEREGNSEAAPPVEEKRNNLEFSAADSAFDSDSKDSKASEISKKSEMG